jgi:fimbrial chaperone protein
VSVDLSGAEPRATVALRNTGKEPVRLEVQTAAWSQSPEGELQTAPTDELVVFPPLLTLAPGEERNLRVGTTARPGATERTYRVFLQELPPAEKPGERQQVRVLSRLGLPVFVAPERPASAARLEGLAAAGGKARFALRNAGTVRIRPAAVKLVATGAAGHTLFARALDAWYVLAGGERRYELPLPQEQCPAIRSLAVEVTLAEGQPPLRAVQPLAEGACAP